MSALVEILDAGRRVEHHRPWPRVTVDAALWRLASEQLRDGAWTLIAFWGETRAVHLAVMDAVPGGQIGVLSLACPAGRFPSVARLHPPAIRLERMIVDLFGLAPDQTPDPRPWLDHGRWGVAQPLSREPRPVDSQPPYAFLAAEGDSLHQIPVGPVHAGIIEPGHFRFTANGETVVRLEARLGYVHRGIEKLLQGSDVDHGAKLAARTSGDSTVAYGIAFAHAVEAALGLGVPPRGRWLRGVMAELERLANHLGDIGAICNDASFALMQAHCGILRERVLRAAAIAFGHRLLRDVVVPGGVASDITPAGTAAIKGLLEEIRRRFPSLIRLYDDTASLQDRTVGTGLLKPDLARRFGAGGFIGRASGRAVDMRRWPGYAPYDDLSFDVPTREDGDVNARIWIRIAEVNESLRLLDQLLDLLPTGAHHAALTLESCDGPREGAALVEGFRGDIFVWLRLGSDGRIERCHLRDPSWFQWPLLEAAIEGNIVADFPLCNKSFNCSYAGVDL